jgi:lysophospholipase L1-like esterase
MQVETSASHCRAVTDTLQPRGLRADTHDVVPRLLTPTLKVVLVTALALAACATSASAQAVYRPQVLVVGDSLAVGMRPFLGALLPGTEITWDVRSGRTTPTGLAQLRARLREQRPTVVIVSLGTNDGRDPARFASRLARALAAIPPDACILWSSIDRPPRKGPYAELNRVLWAAARGDQRLTVVDWRGAVATGRVALPDGLHPDAAGYELRSRMFAAAMQRAC